jgi:hypothetical protein
MALTLPRRRIRIVLLGLLAAAVVAGAVAIYRIGPRNVIGMLRYDQRREGSLKVSDPAPDIVLERPDGLGPVPLSRYIGQKPLVLVFGSYT